MNTETDKPADTTADTPVDTPVETLDIVIKQLVIDTIFILENVVCDRYGGESKEYAKLLTKLFKGLRCLKVNDPIDQKINNFIIENTDNFWGP